LTLSWFARLWNWFTALRGRALAWFRRTKRTKVQCRRDQCAADREVRSSRAGAIMSRADTCRCAIRSIRDRGPPAQKRRWIGSAGRVGSSACHLDATSCPRSGAVISDALNKRHGR
jgi:hypothetical protein